MKQKRLGWLTAGLLFTAALVCIACDTPTNPGSGTGAPSPTPSDPEPSPTPTTPAPVVTTINPAGVTLNQTSLSLTVGGTVTLTATVSPANAANKSVTWASSDTAIATVSNGTVTAIAEGNANITVTTVSAGKTAVCAVAVSSSAGVPFVHYWLNEEEGKLTLNEGSASIGRTESVTIAPQGLGYTGQRWYINGVEDTAKAGQPNYDFRGAIRAPGKYTIGLSVSIGGAYYYAEFVVTVTN